ncbi:MAG TPA: hypothetical protein VLS48_06800 [Anaerolineales bacterium]|nr:hypothetical protein [Anaerolineales bacterium]
MRNKLLFIFCALLVVAAFPGLNSLAALPPQEEAPPAEQPAESDLQTAEVTIYIPTVINRFPFVSVFGVEAHSLSGTIEANELGSYWVRRNAILWPEVEPVKGQRNWTALAELEDEFIQSAQQGSEIVMIVRNTPDWAQKFPGSECGPIKESELASFGSFMHDVVRRYSRPPYNVKYWEIGNEPDMPMNYQDEPYGCWGDMTDPYYGGGYYAEMLKQTYNQIKAADPQAQVMVGGLLLDCDPNNPPIVNGVAKDCSISKFLEGVLRNGGGDYFDGVSFHSYDYYSEITGLYGNGNWNEDSQSAGPSFLPRAEYIQGLLDQYNVRGKFLFSSETSMLCSIDCDEDYELTKAYYVVQLYTQSMVEQLHGAVWYDLNGGWKQSGLMYSDGTPRPAYYAFQTTRKLLGGLTYKREISAGNVRGFEFEGAGKLYWVVWSTDAAPHAFDLPNTPLEILDYMGQSQTSGATLTVDAAPIFVRLR